VQAESIALFIVVVTVLSVLWLSQQQRKIVQQLLIWVPPILFSYIIPASITHLFNLNLSTSALHSISRNWIVPVAIITVMSSLSFLKLKQVGVKPIILFVSGSFAIAVLAPALVAIFGLVWPASIEVFITQGYWRGLIPIVGSWIGGSTSQLVMKELVNCPESLFLSVIVLDNILVNGWTILMFQAIQKSDWINKKLRITALSFQSITEDIISKKFTSQAMAIMLLAILTTTLLVNFLTENFIVRVGLLSGAGFVLGNLRMWNHALVLKAGSILIIIIMAILGLRLNFTQLALPWPFILLCLVWIIGHFIIMLVVAKFLNLHLAWVPIASMANVGGISTAPAVAAAYHADWMPHAILLAIVSMVSSNVWGLLAMLLFDTLIL
jgi:uncharacterized membrane protein